MNKTLTRIAAALIACAAALPAAAGPFQIGPVVGANLNTINLSSDDLSSDNRCGFAVGAMAKFTVPIINIGVDLSAMYEYRTTQMDDSEGTTENLHYSYIAVPLHLRYDVPMPAISSVFFPTVFTGPNFAFRLGNGVVKDFKANKYNIGWDFGIGVTLIKHLQVSAAYTLGISSKAIYANEDSSIKGKTNGWTITAAYLF